jgi:hypothetical protein
VSKLRRPAAARRQAEIRFWGAGYEAPAEVTRIRPTSDPAVIVRSLGPPPVGVDPSVSLGHLGAVYEEAVRAATALAAANGILASGEDDSD